MSSLRVAPGRSPLPDERDLSLRRDVEQAGGLPSLLNPPARQPDLGATSPAFEELEPCSPCSAASRAPRGLHASASGRTRPSGLPHQMGRSESTSSTRIAPVGIDIGDNRFDDLSDRLPCRSHRHHRRIQRRGCRCRHRRRRSRPPPSRYATRKPLGDHLGRLMGPSPGIDHRTVPAACPSARSRRSGSATTAAQPVAVHHRGEGTLGRERGIRVLAEAADRPAVIGGSPGSGSGLHQHASAPRQLFEGGRGALHPRLHHVGDPLAHVRARGAEHQSGDRRRPDDPQREGAA